MRTVLVTYKGYSGYVAQDTVNEFQKVILTTGVDQETTSNFIRLLSHVLLRLMPRRLDLLSLYKKNAL